MSLASFDRGWWARATHQIWWSVGYLTTLFAGLVLGAFEVRRSSGPFLAASLAVLMVIVFAWLIRPRAALYATVFLTAVSDANTVWWFPFAKNLSSWESISYVADSLAIRPVEISLVVGFTITGVREFARHRRPIVVTELTWPIVAFTAFVVLGFLRGVGASGGDMRIALFEGRALLYLLPVYCIAVAICTESKHLRALFWAAICGVVVQSLLSLRHYFELAPAVRADLERLTEHGSAVGQNLVLVALLGAALFGGSRRVRWLLVLGAAPTLYVYLLAQRRAGIAALAVAIIMLFIALYWRRRRWFWAVAPITAIAALVYLAAFWNSDATVAFPAQALKPVIAPNQASLEDRNSDLYRMIEDFDLNYTIRTDPIRGLGFGQPFYQPVPLPDISFFEFHAYIPHNSILWFWIKTGFGGFTAMMYLFAKAVSLGAKKVRELADGPDVIVALAGPIFVAMYATFTYVDISWDARNMVLLGTACALCTRPRSPHDDASPADEVPAAADQVPAASDKILEMTSA